MSIGYIILSMCVCAWTIGKEKGEEEGGGGGERADSNKNNIAIKCHLG